MLIKICPLIVLMLIHGSICERNDCISLMRKNHYMITQKINLPNNMMPTKVYKYRDEIIFETLGVTYKFDKRTKSMIRSNINIQQSPTVVDYLNSSKIIMENGKIYYSKTGSYENKVSINPGSETIAFNVDKNHKLVFVIDKSPNKSNRGAMLHGIPVDTYGQTRFPKISLYKVGNEITSLFIDDMGNILVGGRENNRGVMKILQHSINNPCENFEYILNNTRRGLITNYTQSVHVNNEQCSKCWPNKGRHCREAFYVKCAKLRCFTNEINNEFDKLLLIHNWDIETAKANPTTPPTEDGASKDVGPEPNNDDSEKLKTLMLQLELIINEFQDVPFMKNNAAITKLPANSISENKHMYECALRADFQTMNANNAQSLINLISIRDSIIIIKNGLTKQEF